MENITLEYKGLPITIYGEWIDTNYYEEPHYEEKEEREVDFDYEVPKTKIIDILADISEDIPEYVDVQEYIIKNFDSLFNTHKEEVLNYLEDEAIKAAEDYYNEQESWGGYNESL